MFDDLYFVDIVVVDLVLAKRLAGKSIPEMTYLVTSGTIHLNSINQSINQHVKTGNY